MAIGYNGNKQLVVNLGKGNVCVGSFIYREEEPPKAVMCFTPLEDTYKIGEDVREMVDPQDAKSIIVFDNAESLDLVIRHLNRLRSLID